MIGQAVAAWVIDALIASALLMAGVLLARGPVRRAFGAEAAYALWALPVLRLGLPPLPDAWGRAAPISRVGEQVTVLVVELPAEAAAHPPAFGPMLATAWAAGAVAFLLWHWAGYVRFHRRLIAGAVPVAECGGVRVIETPAAHGPLAFGIRRRYVAFPSDVGARYDRHERELALAHELGHHARGDLLANWIGLVVLALHWWNPLAWRAFRAFRADQELANDARVLAGRDPAERHAYARAIVKSAQGSPDHGPSAAICHLTTVADLKGRLRMLSTATLSRRRLAGGVAATALLTLAGLGITASGSRAAEVVSASVGGTLGVGLVQQPLPAVPPAPPIGETPLPPLPLVPPVPGSAGEAGVATTATTDGKTVRTRLIRARGGERIDLAAIPEISSRVCTEKGVPRDLVVNEKSGDKHRVIICTDRIEKLASEGAAVAANSKAIEATALASALSGLRAARETVASNRDITDEDRREALQGIEEALREVESDLGGVN